jgi:hypothetical protein
MLFFKIRLPEVVNEARHTFDLRIILATRAIENHVDTLRPITLMFGVPIHIIRMRTSIAFGS